MWADASRVKIHNDLRYQNDLSLDIYEPLPKMGARPWVLVVHGGGWSGRSRQDMNAISYQLAEAGFVAVNVSYRFAPAHLHPAPIEDLTAAVQWVKANAKTYGIDFERAGAWGYSAGGHLVSFLALTLSPTILKFRTIVAGGTPHVFEDYPDSPIIKTYIGEKNLDKFKAASPIRYVHPNAPAFFLYHGSWDRLVDVSQMLQMQEALKKQGVLVETYTVSWLGHVTTFLWSREAVIRGIRFLKTHL